MPVRYTTRPRSHSSSPDHSKSNRRRFHLHSTALRSPLSALDRLPSTECAVCLVSHAWCLLLYFFSSSSLYFFWFGSCILLGDRTEASVRAPKQRNPHAGAATSSQPILKQGVDEDGEFVADVDEDDEFDGNDEEVDEENDDDRSSSSSSSSSRGGSGSGGANARGPHEEAW